MKYWSDDLGWIEDDVVWNGSLHRMNEATHSLIGDQATKGSRFIDLAHDAIKQKELPSKKEMVGKATDGTQIGWRLKTPRSGYTWSEKTQRECACGRKLTATQVAHRIYRCYRCIDQKRHLKRPRKVA